ncbi:MAG: molybdopterin-binding protein [Planctomycetota bacterium]
MTESPVAEVLSIGDEMTGGARVDTNTAWISRRLEDMGIEVAFHTTVGDDLDRHADVLRIAAKRADVLVSTGGLGPTQDDLTRQAIAAAAETDLVFDAESMRHVESIFAARGRSMPESNRIQAMFPRGSRPIFNPQGTAPGVDASLMTPAGDTIRVFALPGVPAEMKTMFDQSVAPELAAWNGRRHIRSRVLKFFGTGESEMERRLGDLIRRGRQPRVGITVSSATISLRITSIAASIGEADQLVEASARDILDRVGELCFGEGESYEQQDAVLDRLRQRGQSLSTVELGAAAPLVSWFAALGDAQHFRGGNHYLSRAAWIDCETCDGLDPAIRQVKARHRADWLLLVDRYPQLPDDPNAKLPIADIKLIVVSPDGVMHERVESIGGHPDILQARIAKSALAWLREKLRNQ